MEEELKFPDWLNLRLKELKTDETVFGPYILSILEDTDETEDEVNEALDELLRDLDSEVSVETLREEIISKWKLSLSQSLEKNALKSMPKSPELTNGDQLDQLLRNASKNDVLSSVKKITIDDTELRLRQAILAQVADESSESDDDDLKNGGGCSKKKSGASSTTDPEPEFGGRNANIEKVLSEQRESKDRARAEAAKKRERDKEDRLKQKASAADRKEKAKKKATKVERKR